MTKEGSIDATFRSTEKRRWVVREESAQRIPSNRIGEYEFIVLDYQGVHRLGSALGRSQFWNKYEEIASTFDMQLISRLESEVDISMLFAGLFSAVNTAFIIATQANITAVNPAAVASIVGDGGLVSSRNWTTVLSYASLSTSLLAAFGCLLAKQWLGHFKATRSTHGSISSRGLLRQRKFDAMQNSHLHIILDCFPLLLQMSLLLFAISLLGNTWSPYRDVAGIILAAAGTGVALYLATFFAALFSLDSPFQTPLSRLAHLVSKFVLQASLTLHQSAGFLRFLGAFGSRADAQVISLSIPTLSEEGPAVRWLSQISTDPAAVTAAANMAAEVDWPVGFDASKFISSLWETFRSCFDVQSNDYNTISFSCSNLGRAYACSKALCHLYAEALHAQHEADPELQDILASVALYLSSTHGLSDQQEQGFTFICGLISLIQHSSPATLIGVPEEELSWVSHIIPAFLRSKAHDEGRRAWVELAASIISMFSRYEPAPEKVLADHWIIIALIIGVRIEPDDLVKVDKSSAIVRLREEVHAFVDPVPSYWETPNDITDSAIRKTPTNDLALAFHLIYRLLSVEQDRVLSEGQETDTGSKCIAGLYEILTTREDADWDDYGRVIIEVILRTANLLPYIRWKALQKSKRYVHHALRRAVEAEDAETVGLLLPFWFDASQQSVDSNLCFDAITLLLASGDPRLCHTAFHSAIRALVDSSRHSLRHLLRRDESKLEHFVDTLLVPLRMVYTISSSSVAEWDHALMTNSQDRLNVTLGYLRVIATLAEDTTFHSHLYAWGHIQRCLGIRLDTQALEGADAAVLEREHAFLLLTMVAALGTCAHPKCIEAAVHPSATMVAYDPLAWQTILRALEYIQCTPDARLDADRIARIARYIKLVYRPPQDVPSALRSAIAASIHQTNRSALDSALVRLLRVFDAVGLETRHHAHGRRVSRAL